MLNIYHNVETTTITWVTNMSLKTGRWNDYQNVSVLRVWISKQTYEVLLEKLSALHTRREPARNACIGHRPLDFLFAALGVSREYLSLKWHYSYSFKECSGLQHCGPYGRAPLLRIELLSMRRLHINQWVCSVCVPLEAVRRTSRTGKTVNRCA